MLALRHSAALAALLVASTAGAAFALTGAEAVHLRRARFGEMTRAIEFAAHHWNDAPLYADVAKAGALIERDAGSLPALFPSGTRASDGFRTAALDSVWNERAGFDRLAKRLSEQAAKLAAIGPGTADGDVRRDIQAMAETCRACHRSYRAD